MSLVKSLLWAGATTRELAANFLLSNCADAHTQHNNKFDWYKNYLQINLIFPPIYLTVYSSQCEVSPFSWNTFKAHICQFGTQWIKSCCWWCRQQLTHIRGLKLAQWTDNFWDFCPKKYFRYQWVRQSEKIKTLLLCQF